METCYFCKKGALEERIVTVDFRWGDKLIVIEGVPAKVCTECGERYYSAETSREMDKVATECRSSRLIQVPVVSLTEESCTST
jgi:YgiT-type zinc finger domain-containing protein